MRFYIIDFSAFDYSICFIQRNRPEGRNCNEDETSQNSRREDQFGWPLLPCLPACLPACPYSQPAAAFNKLRFTFLEFGSVFRIVVRCACAWPSHGRPPTASSLSLKDERIPSLDFDSLFFFPVFLAAPYTCYQCDEVNEAEEIIFGSGRGRREQGTIERGTIPSFGLGGRRTNGEPKGGGNQLRQAPPICFSFWFPQRWSFSLSSLGGFKPPPATWAVVSRRQHLLQSTHISIKRAH